MKGEEWPILGYADKFSVAPGASIRVMVSTDRDSYSGHVVRLGGANPQPVDLVGNGAYGGRLQPSYPGSYVLVAPSPLLEELLVLMVHAWIYPTLPNAGRLQGLVTSWDSVAGGWGIFLDEGGRLSLRIRAGNGLTREYTSRHPLRPRTWYHVTCVHGAGKVRLTQRASRPWPEARTVVEFEAPPDELPTKNKAPLLIGAGIWQGEPRPHAEAFYEGKIENPALFAAVLDQGSVDRLADGEAPDVVAPSAVIASWDFSRGISTSEVSDTSPNRLNGTAVNVPMRGVTGHNWRASEQSFARSPDQYGAIHFHSDDLSDSAWEPDFTLKIPDDLGSGAYAVHLVAGAETDDVPFFVLPRPSARAPILFLVPTFTYLAYGNKHPRRGEGPHKAPTPSDLLLARHPELGISIYDRHQDGSGCAYASRLRPIVNMRPDRRTRPRHYSADLLFLEWLERKRFMYDVITDEDLHLMGREALADYQVVITGSHPEYVTGSMLDSLHSYVESGGKMMYLGGNGFYWVTSIDAERPYIMEVRRGVAGTREWSSEPGEQYHSTSGEFGGLWRHRGRPPNQLVGVGLSATSGVGAVGAGYIRQAGGFREDVSFVFRGIGDDEVIGDVGPGPGAAGDEVDRMDADLGTPPSTVLLAWSRLNPSYLIAIEELGLTTSDQDATKNPRARADMVYVTNAAGGAVFSVGSINWFRSLVSTNDNNNVSRVTENVVRHFLGMDDLPRAQLSGWVAPMRG